MAHRFLFVEWEGGDNLPPSLGLTRRLVERGNDVRVLGEPCNAAEIEAAGCIFVSYTNAPHRATKSATEDFVRDWEATSPVEALARLQSRLMFGPALAYARDVLAELAREPADVVVTNYVLFGAMAAAEKAAIPYVVLAPGIYEVPRPGAPPVGLGLQPMRGPLGAMCDALLGAFVQRLAGRGLPALNAAREQLQLNALHHPWQAYDRAARMLVLTSPSFDWTGKSLPSNVRFAGPQIDDPAWAEAWQSPWQADAPSPLVVASLSTTYMNQDALTQKIIDSFDGLSATGLITVGPSIDPDQFHAPANAIIRPAAPHNQIFPLASVVITHAGHGTAIRALASGVPLLCIPMGRDQSDIAARVVARGAGLRLSPQASVEVIRQAIRRLLEEPSFHEHARRLGAAIAEDARHSTAVDELEAAASSAHLTSPRHAADPAPGRR